MPCAPTWKVESVGVVEKLEDRLNSLCATGYVIRRVIPYPVPPEKTAWLVLASRELPKPAVGNDD